MTLDDYNGETVLRQPIATSSLEIVVNLLTTYRHRDYFAYEQGQRWYIGLGRESSLTIDPSGSSAIIQTGVHELKHPVSSTLAHVARAFIADYSKPGSKVFGHVGFNYAAHSRGLSYIPGNWPLLSLMVPSFQVTVEPDTVTLRGRQGQEFRDLANALASGNTAPPQGVTMNVDFNQGASQYIVAVEAALKAIQDAKVTKVVVSRTVELQEKVDMPATLFSGRKSNTPKRTFSFSHAGYQATGFSPELILSVENGKVVTEPLAGTRSCGNDQAECDMLRNELLNDPKEIVEHIVSVKESIGELEKICSPKTVVVEDLMSVCKRGKVQHLGSRVAGILKPEKDAWDAFNVLFPSITASGIPKNAALRTIESLELVPRELYSGGIIIIDPLSNDFEGALVLRSMFQDRNRQWVQAGAGVISQSQAEREFTETCEKLSTIASFLTA